MRFKDRRGVIFVSNGRGYERETPKPKHITGTDKERGPRGGRHRKRREAWEAAVQAQARDIEDHCTVCGKVIPPGPDFCSAKCEQAAMEGRAGTGTGKGGDVGNS